MNVVDRHGRLVTRYCPEVTSAEARVALDLLESLSIRPDGGQPKTSYDRSVLPLSWARIARLGMDVKDITLARAIEPSSRVFDSDGFTLRYGRMVDPYTGESVVFEQVVDVADRMIDLDHVVALSDAFVSGGHRWKTSGYNWMNLANDPGNLMVVGQSVNRSKGGRSAAEWLPDNPVTDFRRRYVVLQIQVKARYRLSATVSEATVMRQILG